MLLLTALFGCPGEFKPIAEPIRDYVPFEESIGCLWDLQSDDTLLGYALEGEISDFEFLDAYNTYTHSYTRRCLGAVECDQGALDHEIVWSERGGSGTFIDAVTGVDGTTTVFDPPLKFAANAMLLDDFSTTETGGATYTSTLVGFGDCRTFLQAFDSCANFVITSDDGGAPAVLGSYWMSPGFGMVSVDWDDDTVGIWGLTNHTRPDDE